MITAGYICRKDIADDLIIISNVIVSKAFPRSLFKSTVYIYPFLFSIYHP